MDMANGAAQAWYYATKSGETFATIGIEPQPSPSDMPKGKKDDKGINIHLGKDLGESTKKAWKKTNCKHEDPENNNTDCIAKLAMNMMLNGQTGAEGAAFSYTTKDMTDLFPKMKNTALLGALAIVKDSVGQGYYALPNNQKGAVTAMATVATWLAFAHIGWGTDPSNHGDFYISAKTANDQTPPDDEKDCPDEEHTPFCKNCGGNQNKLERPKAGTRGQCVGRGGPKNEYKDCACFPDVHREATFSTKQERIEAFKWLNSLPDLKPSDYDEPKEEITCWTKDEESNVISKNAGWTNVAVERMANIIQDPPVKHYPPYQTLVDRKKEGGQESFDFGSGCKSRVSFIVKWEKDINLDGKNAFDDLKKIQKKCTINGRGGMLERDKVAWYLGALPNGGEPAWGPEGVGYSPVPDPPKEGCDYIGTP